MIKLKPMMEETEQPKKFQLDIFPGDIILAGKFRNKPYTVAGFGKDENNQPIIITTTGKKLKFLSIRIEKLLPKIKK